VALLAAGVAALWSGRQRVDLVLISAAIWTLSLLAMSGIAAGSTFLAARRSLRRAAREPGLQLEAIEGHPLRPETPVMPRGLPLAASPRLRWVSPPARAIESPRPARENERIAFEDRFRAQEIVRELVVEDVLGLWRLTSRLSQPCGVRILPDPGRLAAHELAASLSTGDFDSWPFGPPRGDLADFRTYTRSDPARLILWKAYARSRQLLVRAPEPARSPEGRPLVYLVAAPADGAAAAAARVLLESGCLGEELPFACDGAPSPVKELARALDLIAGSSRARDIEGGDLATALADPTLGAGDPVLLIVPAATGAWLPRVLPCLAASPQRFIVLAAADAAEPARPRRRAARLLLRPPAAAPGFDSLVEGLRPVAATGARLVIADRVSGRLLRLDPAAPPARGAKAAS